MILDHKGGESRLSFVERDKDKDEEKSISTIQEGRVTSSPLPHPLPPPHFLKTGSESFLLYGRDSRLLLLLLLRVLCLIINEK